MATPVVLPVQGQSVETCFLVAWLKQPGDTVTQGEALAEVETDKASFEVESPCDGTLLVHFFPVEADIPVLTTMAAVGEPGEDASGLAPDGVAESATPAEEAPVAESAPAAVEAAAPVAVAAPGDGLSRISPRARQTAAVRGVAATGLAGSGPEGRILERDVLAAAASGTVAAAASGGDLSQAGSGIGGRVTRADLAASAAAAPVVAASAVVAEIADEVEEIPIKGIRKLIGERMHASLANSAQLTLSRTAPGGPLLAMRKRFKGSNEALGLNRITVNDLMLFATAKALTAVPELNATVGDNKIRRTKQVHLAFAVDTNRGLMVPVIRNADTLSLAQLSERAKTLAVGCIEGGVQADDLQGGTFTVSNLGGFGIEQFTPVLNTPQVGILGVGGIKLEPVRQGGEVVFEDRVSLSLTIDHMVVDGAPAARFLATLADNLADLDVLLAL